MGELDAAQVSNFSGLAGQSRGYLFDAMADVDDGRAAAPVEAFLAVDVIEVGSAAGPDQRERPMEVSVKDRSLRIAIFRHGDAPILSLRAFPLSKYPIFFLAGIIIDFIFRSR
jgi:hypothetical protein